HPAPVRRHSRHPGRRQDAEGLEPGARDPRPRPARHGEDLRGHREVLRAAARAGRQGDEGGQTLDQIKAEVKMPEYASWASQDRYPTNIAAAWRALGGK